MKQTYSFTVVEEIENMQIKGIEISEKYY
jgi:hypothetical protein